MKVLILTNMFPTAINPAYGVFVKGQVESLEKIGVHTHVFFLNGREKKIAYFRAIFDLAKLLKGHSFVLAHTHHTYCNYALYAAMHISGKSLPVVTTFHEGEVWAAKPEISDQSRLQRLRLKNLFQYARENIFFKRTALQWVDAIIAVDREMIKKVLRKGKIPLVYEIPCGVDIELFKPLAKEESRKFIGLPQNHSLIFFPSNPTRHEKGFYLLQAAVQLLEDGKGPGLRIVAAGGIPHEKMSLYYNAADVVVHPSLYEASPTAVKEAMACNAPIVASRAGDTARILDDMPGHFLCSLEPRELAHKIKDAIGFGKRTEGRNRIAALGLDMDSTAKKIQDVYEDVIKKASRFSGER